VTIVCLIPVLGRPQNAKKVASSLRLASPKVRLVFICSPNDREQIAACRETAADVLIADWEPERGDFAKKIALGYRSTKEPWIFQGADDVAFEKGWDEAALECAEETGALVIGTWDGGNPLVMRGRHSTHTLIARSYCDDPGASFDGPGTVFSEAYAHQSVDVELIELAKRRGVWSFCPDAKVIHKHPFWPGGPPVDATYEKGLADGRADARLFAQRHRQWLRQQRARV
jgi:hypothetical protein